MFASKLITAASAFAGIANAQQLPGAIFDGQNYSVSGPIAVEPSSVDYNTRATWCITQKQQCPSICMGPAQNNTCDIDTLVYNCTCKNGTVPNVTRYEQSLPGLACRQWYQDCQLANVGNATAQANCVSVRDSTCGNMTIAAPSASTHSSALAGSMTSPASSVGNGGHGTASLASTLSSDAAATAIAFTQEFGTPLVAGGLVALFGFAL